MQNRRKSSFPTYVAACIGLCGASAALPQSYRSEASLLPNYFLGIPALEVGDKFYQVSLDYRDGSWALQAAVATWPIDSDYASGSYDNGVLELKCVKHNGNYYSARLVGAAPGNYSFTLAAYTRLDSCPLPPNLSPARGQWVRTAQSPLSARDDVQFAWNGEEIFVLGGSTHACGPSPLADCVFSSTDRLLNDGAAYDPATNTWRKIADAPASMRGNPVAVGQDIFGLALDSHASPVVRLLRYRSAQDKWEEVQLPPNLPWPVLAAYGSSLVAYSRDDSSGTSPDWLFDSVTGVWTQLPDSPLGPAFSRQYVAHGQDLYLFDRALTPSPGGADGPSYLRAARLRGQQWRLLASADSIGPAPTLLSGQRLIAPELGCADGGGTNGYGRCIPYGAVFDTATDTWSSLPNEPGRGLKYFSASGGFGESGVVLTSPGKPAFDATTDEWFIFPALDPDPSTRHRIGAAGPYGFAFGGITAPRELLNDAWIWAP